MNEELAMRSLAYLMGYYKEQDEVILNDEDIEAIKYLQKQNEQLQNNWNELKKWLNNFHKNSEFEQWEIVNKIQELEGKNE